ncbi:hypothetical protein Hanom_Chr08g00725421 [Helianthus anomalus]
MVLKPMIVQDREVVAEIGVSVSIRYRNMEIITSSEKVHQDLTFQHNNLLLNRNWVHLIGFFFHKINLVTYNFLYNIITYNCSGGGPRIMAALVQSMVMERVAGRPLWSQAS